MIPDMALLALNNINILIKFNQLQDMQC